MYHTKYIVFLILISYFDFQLEGSKGPSSQTSASVLDEKTNVLFLTQLCKDGVACWNTNKPLNPENLGLIVQDHENLIFTNDMKASIALFLYLQSWLTVFNYFLAGSRKESVDSFRQNADFHLQRAEPWGGELQDI